MKVNKPIYNYFFHPLSDKHSKPIKALAVITVVALTILTVGLYLIPFIALNLRDRKIKTVQGNNPIHPHTPNKPAKPKPPAMPDRPPANLTTVVDRVQYMHKKQLEQFEYWANQKMWGNIHDAHYDWWMYPLNKDSAGQGDLYTLTQADIDALKNDPKFMKDYLKGFEIVVRAWGWELKDEKPVAAPIARQDWQKWDVRLGKMAQSLRLFGEKEYFRKLQFYALQSVLPRFRLQDWVMTALRLCSAKMEGLRDLFRL